MPEVTNDLPQYSRTTILKVWAAAALPMGVLGWVVAPALSVGSAHTVLVRIAVLTVGLAWQFVLTLYLVSRETGSMRWSVVRPRLWLTTPRSPATGETQRRLWWMLLPLAIVTAAFELLVKPRVDALWVSALPFLAESSSWALGTALGTPEARAQLIGAWGTWALYLVNALFNSVLGEELLFRGLLLPRMSATCGPWDWLVNSLLFGAYHLHQPWGMVSSVLHGVLFAWPSRYLRSAWFGIVAHSGQSVYFAVILLALVLGLASR